MTRTVITGIGAIAPGGIGIEEHWESTLRGDLHVRPITAFDPSGYSTSIAGQLENFEPERFVDDRMLVQTDRWTWLALGAARLAFADAAYDPSATDPYDTSVILASGLGGVEFGQREIQELWSRGRRAVGAYQSIAWFYAASTGQISIRHGTKGRSGVLVSDGAGGVDSIGAARRAIRRGTAGVVVGGTEAPLCPYALTCQITNGGMTTSPDPRGGYKPFDARANGYAPGEGGALLILEDEEKAAARGARQAYAEVAGYAATHDAHTHDTRSPDPRQYARAMIVALEDAGLTPDDVDLVVADGAGDPALDRAEAEAIHLALGERGATVPVTAPQGFTGRLGSGGAALNVATTLMAMRHSLVPAVGNLDTPAEGLRLDLVTGRPRPMPVRVAMVNARGFGGFNSSLILRTLPGAS
ncbi:ketosynthase chain-length factor [Streptomyces triticagri]|uniref:Ketosynthase chain-length factor n=1 Tax=Streptomyces triticagri TaxID=2293568 RepID=A0A372LW61_9ACTN|nr:beta-ketoacyl synthase N-terminal-like domain-containing protein [Streptomyces triticagri]RFU82789.1 ketosynthase chain-length factor [Streptomyces triticagri]